MAKRKKPLSLLKTKRDDAGYILELRCTQEELNREGNGNTLRRYLDDRLRKELNYPAKEQTRHVKRIRSVLHIEPKWDAATRNFIVYHCRKHNFYPDSTTIKNKCSQYNCFHLYPQRKKEIIVKTLNEALALKRIIDSVQIEQIPAGFRVTVH
ncbi:MAG: hypothetical protein ACQXXG_09130 [Candidatus Bathyarchaeia archaeon]|jgi:hypothetical protein